MLSDQPVYGTAKDRCIRIPGRPCVERFVTCLRPNSVSVNVTPQVTVCAPPSQNGISASLALPVAGFCTFIHPLLGISVALTPPGDSVSICCPPIWDSHILARPTHSFLSVSPHPSPEHCLCPSPPSWLLISLQRPTVQILKICQNTQFPAQGVVVHKKKNAVFFLASCPTQK